MRKEWFCALMISLPLALSACAAPNSSSDGNEKNNVQLLQEEYQTLSGCDMTANVRCDWENEVETYTLQCHWQADGVSTVEVLAPEELAGITAEFNGENLTLVYDDISLAAGTLSSEELSPAQILPMTMDAIREGYILEKGVEEINGDSCIRLLFDVTGTGGNKIEYVVWFGTGHTPVRAEVQVENAVIFTAEFTDFTVVEADTMESGAEE